VGIQFQQVANSRLYASSANVQGADWWAVLLSATAQPPKGGQMSLDDALNKFNATFLYSPVAPDLNVGTDKFIAAIDALTKQRAMIFLRTADPAQITADTAPLLVLSTAPAPITVQKGLKFTLTAKGIDPPLQLEVSSGAQLGTSKDGNSLTLTSNTGYPTVAFPQLNSVSFQQSASAVLSVGGTAPGTFQFAIAIYRSALKQTLNWGFQALVPNMNRQKPTIKYLAAWFPLADFNGDTGTDQIGFNAQINVVNPANQVEGASLSKLFFTGTTIGSGGQTQTVLDSFFRPNAGVQHIQLIPNADASNGQQPAGLVIANGYQATPNGVGFTMEPDGDFILALQQPGVQTVTMMAGLSGTETITFRPQGAGYAGYRMRFQSLQPGYAPVFPLVSYSPVSAPIDPKAKLLDPTYTTAWASVLPPPGDAGTAFYTAAPKGADLFGLPASTGKTASAANTLVPTSPGMPLSPQVLLPLIPFAGFKNGTGERDLTTAQLADLERQILSPTRRAQISEGPQQTAPHAQAALGMRLTANDQPKCPFNATTPAGFISGVNCDGSWGQLLLAQVMAPAPSTAIALQMGFTKLTPQLQSAFQTNNMFLVVANANYLGAPASGVFMPAAPAPPVASPTQFYNTVSIGDWQFQASVGTENQYSDYRNVMIVKGVKGKLIDLVVSPDKWTMRTEFAAPTVKDSAQPDITQLVPLSAWISNYFSAALARLNNAKDRPYFQKFCDIIQSDDWTGVLMLRVDIANVPKDLAGITAGVNDPADFYAHHIGFDISQVDGTTVQQKGASSVFGLVYYIDPAYDDTQGTHAIAPRDATQPYDFTLLTLKALFVNSALQKFDSLAQVVLNQVFGAAVQSMGTGGNIYNAILLQGAVQKHGDAAVYSLGSTGVNTYLLSNNVLTSVEVDSAVMSTRDDGSVSGTVVSWIAMGGFMNFAFVKDLSGTTPPLPDVDIFGFGSVDGTPAPQQGLNFSNLGLQISFPKQKVQVFTHSAPVRGLLRAQDAPKSTLTMVEGEISFNVANSAVRQNGLFKDFQMELLGLQSGADKTTPDSLGYAAVANEYGLQGPGSAAWHGLRCNLNMGTPGELAGKINLTSTMLLSWSDASGSDGSYAAGVGLLLPGASSGGEIFSLQSIIKLSIGVVQLFFNPTTKSFLLLMNEIALKFFGLLKIPPNGATAFFLFGNPNGTSPTGLGWFAIYNQEQTSGDKKLADTRQPAAIGAGTEEA
jgi:hypothetical protein